MKEIKNILFHAWKKKTVVPAFNIPYLPMMGPVVRALKDTQSFGLIAVARLEWEKFESGGLRQIYEEYQRHKDEHHTRLHLDHVPVIDEDNQRVDYERIIQDAIKLGYDSVMVDGSRLSLEENIKTTGRIVDRAHQQNVAVEAELGAVLGHEEGPLPDYEELFSSGKGFTLPDEAGRFVRETGVDWLSVAVGSIHGAISGAAKNKKKLEARIQIERLTQINEEAKIPLVLHGGTGIPKQSIQQAIAHGIAKINIATAIRQPYERLKTASIRKAQEAVYEEAVHLITNELETEGTALLLNK